MNLNNFIFAGKSPYFCALSNKAVFLTYVMISLFQLLLSVQTKRRQSKLIISLRPENNFTFVLFVV